MAYIINLDKYESIGTCWIVNAENVTYFDSFGENKNIITNIYRIQAYNSIMCGYLCIEFIELMLKGNSLLQYTNLFSSNRYKKNDKIILKYFQ